MRLINGILAATITAAVATAVQAQDAVPIGGEFQINTHTAGNQISPAIAHQADGGFVVVWRSLANEIQFSILGQRYGADGQKVAEEFQVDTYPGSPLSPNVAPMADGGFLVVWDSVGSSGADDSGISVQAKRYGPDGNEIGHQFQVNTIIRGHQVGSSVATLTNGGFVVAWSSIYSAGTDTDLFSVQARRYSASGAPVGAEFQVNTYTIGNQGASGVAGLEDGGFVVLWTSQIFDDEGARSDLILGQRYDAAGLAMGEEFEVPTDIEGFGVRAEVSALSGGGFVAVWPDARAGTSISPDVQGQLFDADGATVGENFRINLSTPYDQKFPSVSALANGGFVVAWESIGSSGSDISFDSVQARRFDAGGNPLSGEFQVNSYTEYDQNRPAVSVSPDDGFVAVWSSDDSGPEGSDTDGLSIQGQRYEAPRFRLTGPKGDCLAAGETVALDACDSDEDQTWRLDLSALPQKLVDPDGQCLVPDFEHPSGEVQVAVSDCAGVDDETTLWRLETPGSSRPSRLIHAATGLCLDAGGTTQARLLPCSGDADQIWRPAAAACAPDYDGLCLNPDRFRIDLEWNSFDGTTGSGQAVPVKSDDSGLLWFFERDNWEMLIKVLDGCHINDRLWVFAAAATTVEYTLTVTDTATGVIQDYFNPLGNPAAPIVDTSAFATCSAASEVTRRPSKVARAVPVQSAPTGPGDFCDASDNTMCLNGNRFSAEIEYRDHAGNTGMGRVVYAGVLGAGPGSPDTSGMFFFFGPNNWEMLVKVLDGCDINDQFWLITAATTDIEYTLRVTDHMAQVTREYFNPLGEAAPALVDTFDTCP